MAQIVSPVWGERVFGRERWSSIVANLVTASSAAAVWVTSAAIVVLLVISEPRDAAALTIAPRKLQGDELATVQLFQNNTPSVVYITNLAVRLVDLIPLVSRFSLRLILRI